MASPPAGRGTRPAHALSGLIAQALERARLFDAEHAQAQELQRALLPRVLPSLPGVTAAARYIPGAGATIGGDWYDVIPLSADRVALVIGDVMGHGLPEAIIMGRLRTAVQTLSDLELPPDEILSHLSELVAGLGDDCFVTCLYAIYDPVTRTCALLVARARATPAEAVASWALPEDARAASAARQHVRRQLATWRLEDLAPSTEMVASELVANVFRHAHGPVRLRLLRSRVLVCEVFDGSVTTPRIRRTSWTDEGGRGLQLVAALCDRWGTRQLAGGKSIWTEQYLP
jgi:hypothetical protein